VLPADLSEAEAPRAIFEQLRGEVPELLINNAGFGVRGPFLETDWQQEASMMQVNMTAPVLLTKLFLPEMVRRGSGRILNVASTAAFVPGPFMALYYASKAFLMSFSHAIANEVQGTGVTATVLCPGPTVTNFAAAAHAEDSALFRGPVMTAADVAREGFDAMMAGKPQVIAGARNRWMMRGARLLPIDRLAKTTRRLNTT
jgi:short-subunit dehydrogenase